jgi:hypothetical protein
MGNRFRSRCIYQQSWKQNFQTAKETAAAGLSSPKKMTQVFGPFLQSKPQL